MAPAADISFVCSSQEVGNNLDELTAQFAESARREHDSETAQFISSPMIYFES